MGEQAENQKVTPESQPVTNPPITANHIATDLNRFIGEATKYALLTLFGLYAMGFVIWHSYLGSYGVSSIGFLQTEYLSAALCYLIIAICISIPPIVILERMVRGDKTHSIQLLLYVCYIISTKVLELFIPNPVKQQSINNILNWYLVAIPICWFTFQFLKRRYNNKLINKICDFEWLSVYFLGYIVFQLFSNDKISWQFVLCTLSFVVFMTEITGAYLRKMWHVSQYKIKTLFILVNCLVFMSTLAIFGSKQFPEIGRQFGGGKPETVYLKFTKGNEDIPRALGISACTNLSISPDFFGPVDLLLKTDKEIYFLYRNESCLPLLITNITPISPVTNVTHRFVTNTFSTLITNKTFATTNYQSKITDLFITNVVTLAAQVIMNPTKLTAKQIRSELVESVVFLRQ